ncbi:MAG: hypothetical protein ABIA47_03905 [bacterium]
MTVDKICLVFAIGLSAAFVLGFVIPFMVPETIRAAKFPLGDEIDFPNPLPDGCTAETMTTIVVAGAHYLDCRADKSSWLARSQVWKRSRSDEDFRSLGGAFIR